MSDPAQTPKVRICIAAGGRSARFGQDKARAMLQGWPLILHVVQRLQPIAMSVTAIAETAGKYEDLGITTIADHNPGNGPIAALQAALQRLDTAEDWVLLASCDVPLIPSDWVRQLLISRKTTDQAVAFRGDFWEPMPALYRKSLLNDVNERITSGRLSVSQLLTDCSARPLPLPKDWAGAGHVNTASDLARLEAQMAGNPSSA